MTQTTRELTYVQAITEAMRQELARDPRVFVMGENIGVGEGAFGATTGLLKEFGPDRIRDTPLSETGFLGAGVGAAVTGLKPIVEIMFVDFVGVTMDPILNQAAKLRYMSGGKIKVPLVVRTAWGGGMSAASQHSQSLASIITHIPGLKCVAPSTPYDAKGLLISAIRQDDPIFFFEHKFLYGIKGPVPEEPYTVPIGKADVKRAGNDVTVVAVGRMVHLALEAAAQLEKEGTSVEVVDPRSLSPLDEDTILASVKKTGRLVVVDESHPRCSMATDIVALAATKGLEYLDAPVKTVTGGHTPVPFSPTLERAYLPSTGKIVASIREIA
ncbi:MAG: alpha-ketoacid dehydrogenase subunit beta [Thaumarchaeota archaeon]|nr:alpha-ketoacid dehydrogenase subunit beta [Nitrososphaerota archaeon]